MRGTGAASRQPRRCRSAQGPGGGSIDAGGGPGADGFARRGHLRNVGERRSAGDVDLPQRGKDGGVRERRRDLGELTDRSSYWSTENRPVFE